MENQQKAPNTFNFFKKALEIKQNPPKEWSRSFLKNMLQKSHASNLGNWWGNALEAPKFITKMVVEKLNNILSQLGEPPQPSTKKAAGARPFM